MRAHLYGGVAARRERIPSIYHVHDTPNFTLSSQGLLQLAVASVRTDVAVGVSQYVAGRFRGRAGRVTAIPNGVPERPCPDGGSAAVRRELRIPDGRKVVTWCGRLQRWKGPDVFLRAAARVRAAFPAAFFVVVGGSLFGLEENYAMMLRSLAAELGLGDAVAFAGHRDDPHPYMCASDLIVHSSVRPEPFGLVIAEAMACGKAVVATAAGGPSEIVDSGRTGLLTSPGDEEELSSAMLALLGDDDRRAAMGTAGRARMKEHFGIHRMVSDFQSLYQAVAGR
jgi:glycosyltransferase involved in cell wall biosynthesis